MSLQRDISPGTSARRSLPVDLLLAIALALLAFQLAAGIGVVGFIALVTTVVLLLWIGVEALVRREVRCRNIRRTRRQRRPSASDLRP